jgi:hypothetical protein
LESKNGKGYYQNYDIVVKWIAEALVDKKRLKEIWEDD